MGFLNEGGGPVTARTVKIKDPVFKNQEQLNAATYPAMKAPDRFYYFTVHSFILPTGPNQTTALDLPPNLDTFGIIGLQAIARPDSGNSVGYPPGTNPDASTYYLRVAGRTLEATTGTDAESSTLYGGKIFVTLVHDKAVYVRNADGQIPT